MTSKYYNKLNNWQDFERLCLDFFKTYLSDETLTQIGNQGSKQEGADIFSYTSNKNLIQCKNKIKGSLSLTEYSKIVTLAKENPYYEKDITQIIIATSADRKKEIQDQAKKDNILVLFWEDFCQELNKKNYESIRRNFFEASDASEELKKLYLSFKEIIEDLKALPNKFHPKTHNKEFRNEIIKIQEISIKQIDDLEFLTKKPFDATHLLLNFIDEQERNAHLLGIIKGNGNINKETFIWENHFNPTNARTKKLQEIENLFIQNFPRTL